MFLMELLARIQRVRGACALTMICFAFLCRVGQAVGHLATPTMIANNEVASNLFSSNDHVFIYIALNFRSYPLL